MQLLKIILTITAFTFFNPTSTYMIADAIEVAITSRQNADEVERVLTKYTWENTAKLSETVVGGKKVSKKDQLCNVTIVGGDFSGTSRVGKFILQLHASLSRYFDVAYYESLSKSNTENRIDFLQYIAKWDRLSAERPIFIGHDNNLAIYNIANNTSSALTLMGALARPGVVLLHDVNLQMVWAELVSQRLISKSRLKLEEQINARYDRELSSWLGSLLSSQYMVVVFSNKAEVAVNAILKALGAKTVVKRMTLPVNTLVYPEIISTEKIKTNLEGIEEIDDLHYEVMLSHATKSSLGALGASTDELLVQAEFEKYHVTPAVNYEMFAHELSNAIKLIKQEIKQ